MQTTDSHWHRGQALVCSAIFRPQEWKGWFILIIPPTDPNNVASVCMLWLGFFFFFFFFYGGLELAGLLCQTSLSSVTFSRLSLCDESRAAGGGEERRVLTLELSQYKLPRTAFAPRINPFIAAAATLIPLKRGVWMAALRDPPFEVWGGFWRAACPLCHWCHRLSCD